MQEHYFETTDFILAATIVATISAPIIKVDCDFPAEKAKFHFHIDDVPNDFVDAFWQGDLRVEPVVFGLAQQYLKTRINGAINNEDSPSGFCI